MWLFSIFLLVSAALGAIAAVYSYFIDSKEYKELPTQFHKNKELSKSSFPIGSALVFEPSWAENKQEFKKNTRNKHPLEYKEIVYFICDIPNAHGHCIIIKNNGKVVVMVHSSEFRLPTEEEF